MSCSHVAAKSGGQTIAPRTMRENMASSLWEEIAAKHVPPDRVAHRCEHLGRRLATLGDPVELAEERAQTLALDDLRWIERHEQEVRVAAVAEVGLHVRHVEDARAPALEALEALPVPIVVVLPRIADLAEHERGLAHRAARLGEQRAPDAAAPHLRRDHQVRDQAAPRL